MSVLAIVDELAALFEPNAGKRDGSAARPVEFLPDMLYAWCRSERFPQDGTGELDEERFVIRIAWCVEAGFDAAAAERSRTATNTIVAKADALVALLRSHRTGASYENVEVSQVDYESLVTAAVRGFYMELTGYQLRS